MKREFLSFFSDNRDTSENCGIEERNIPPSACVTRETPRARAGVNSALKLLPERITVRIHIRYYLGIAYLSR